MWLTKDERTLLAFYYGKDGCCLCKLSDLPIQQSNFDRIHISLRSRGLLNFGINPGRFAGVKVDLTPEGMRLGQIYDSWWLRSNLWYAEHIKNHWIWLFIGFIVGGVITQLINWLWAYLLKTPGAK